MNISFIGTGYVGLVGGACLADKGNKVICADVCEDKIDLLNKGEVPIFESDLKPIIGRNINKNLFFTSDLEMSIRDSDIVFITVGTPMSSSGEVNLDYIYSAAETISKNLNEYKVIVIKSTVPVGTAKRVKEIIQENSSVPFDIVSNPEFLREGSAVEDFLTMNRIVLGSTSTSARLKLKELYSPLSCENILFTDHESAEMVKYATNAFLATKVSFINSIANICEKAGADIDLVSKGLGFDERIGSNYLQAGIGYGGSCLPKDTQALVHISENYGYDFKILKSVIDVNEDQPKVLINKLIEISKEIPIRKVTVLGLAFKPLTKDLRGAASLKIVRELKELNYQINVYDPLCLNEFKEQFGDEIDYYQDLYQAVSGSDVCLILTECEEIKQMDLKKIYQLLNHPIIIDGRNVFDVQVMKQLGFSYHSIGRRL